MLPHLNESRLKGSYYTNTSLASSTRSNVNQNADNALRILNDTDKLMADPKQTATALLAVKYGIFESADTNLSYNLMALSKLLSDHPSAWNVVDQSLIDKITQIAIVIDQPTNVICPALSVLTLITLDMDNIAAKSNFGSLEQSIASYPEFIESLVSRLLSSNVQIIHAALQLINATLLRLVLTRPDTASPYFDQLRDAGLLRYASQLFENKPLAASCSPQLYDLQELIRAIFAQNRQIDVNISDHLHLTSYKQMEAMVTTLIGTNQTNNVDWQRTGLSEGQDPVTEINNSLKWAGIQDFTDFLSQDEMVFKKMYLEHLAFAPPNSRFPLILASLAVSEIMFDIFGVNEFKGDYFNTVPESFIPAPYAIHNLSPTTSTASLTGPKASSSMLSPSTSVSETLNTTTRIAKAGANSSVESELAKLGKLRPLIFDWGLLHSAGIVNFLRLWLVSSAQKEDFENIIEVVRVLFAQAIPNSDFSTVSIDSVISKLDTLSYADIRALQLQNVEEELNSQWGMEIRSLHNQFHQESYDFVKEQRIRLLLRGEWFYIDNPTQPPPTNSKSRLSTGSTAGVAAPTSRRYFVALSPSLNTLHYSEYPKKLDEYPAVDALTRTIDLSTITKVIVTSLTPKTHQPKNRLRVNLQSRTNYSKISLVSTGSRENSTLNFYIDTPEKAAAWGDGLLMLKNKPYQSTETKKYIDMFAETKLRLQMMHITPDDLEFAVKHPIMIEKDYESVQTSDDFYFS